jgi:BlaI family penicillinase repressor
MADLWQLSNPDRNQGAIALAQFTPGELSVMCLLWRHGEMNPVEIQDRFPEPIKNPALRSYLTILLNKGHVTRRKVGRAYLYKAVTRERAAFRSTLREFVESYCGGSVQALMLNLIRFEKFSDEELIEIKRLADAGDDSAKPKPKKRI